MIITIGFYVYLLVAGCSNSSVSYPLVDNGTQDRVITVCTDYGLDQTKEIEMHEIVHACVHNHEHNFKTKKDLANHLRVIPEQSEEIFTTDTAHCILEAWDEFKANDYFVNLQSDNSAVDQR